MDAIEKALADVFSKLPPFPDSLKEALRKYYPWLIIIGSAISALGVLALLGIGSFYVWFVPVYGSMVMLTSVLLGLRALLGLFGGIRMLSGSKQGWNLALYSDLVAVLVNVIDFSLGGIIGNFLMLWALFQIREYYVSEDQSSGSL